MSLLLGGPGVRASLEQLSWEHSLPMSCLSRRAQSCRGHGCSLMSSLKCASPLQPWPKLNVPKWVCWREKLKAQILEATSGLESGHLGLER